MVQSEFQIQSQYPKIEWRIPHTITGFWPISLGLIKGFSMVGCTTTINNYTIFFLVK